jgi:hypothetical protein
MPTTAFKLCIVAIDLALFGSCLRGQGQPGEPTDSNKQSESRAAILGFAANRDSFPFYRCRYKETKAQAASFEEAIAGKWINAVSCEFRVVVNGKKELYECLAPPPVLNEGVGQPFPGNPSLRMVSVPFVGGGYLSDGEREMSYKNGLKAANLFTKRAPYGGKPQGPFSMGSVGEGPAARDANRDQWEAVYHGRELVDNRTVFSVGFRGREAAAGISETFHLDPTQGYLPVKFIRGYKVKPLVDGHPKTQVLLMNARECSRQRWFPERILAVDTPDKKGDAYDVREVKVLSLDADKTPSDDEFTIDVPFGTQVLDPNDYSKGFFKLKQDEKVNIRDLPGLFDMLDKVKTTPMMDTAVNHKRSYLWLRWVGGCIGISLVLAAITVTVRRLRTR